MSFLDDEAGIGAMFDEQVSQPREGLVIETPAVTYRLATGTRDVVIDGHKYTAYPCQRGEIAVPTLGESGGDMTVHIPVTHALIKRYAAGSPPRLVNVTLVRKQLRSGEAETWWRGTVTLVTIDGGIATLRVPERDVDSLDRRLPTIVVGRSCANVLYDRNCRVARAGHQVVTTVTNVNGRTLKVAAIGGHPSGWATYGEVLHTASGERMTVADHTGLELRIQAAIVGLRVGDAVTVYAGCSRDVAMCESRFANVANFAGFHTLNTSTLFRPTGVGVYVSE